MCLIEQLIFLVTVFGGDIENSGNATHQVIGLQVDGELEAEARMWGAAKAKHVVEGQPALQSLMGAAIIEEVPLAYCCLIRQPQQINPTIIMLLGTLL